MTYADIAALAGLQQRTARAYAQAGQFDPSDFRSVLAFITKHRAKRGMPPLDHEQPSRFGIICENAEPTANSCPHCGRQIVIKAG